MYHLAKGLYLLATSKEEYSVILLGLDNAGKTTFHEQVKSLFVAENPAPKLNTIPTVGQNVSTITLPDMYLKIWDVGGQLSLRKLWQSYYASCHAIVFIIDSTDIGDGGVNLDYDNNNGNGNGNLNTDNSASGRAAQSKAASVPASAAPAAMTGSGAGRRASLSTIQEDLDVAAGAPSTRLEECRLVLEDVLKHSDAEGVPLLILANKQDREDCVEVVRIKEGLVKRVFEGERSGGIRDSRVLPVSALTGMGVKEAVGWLRTRMMWNKESRPPVMR